MKPARLYAAAALCVLALGVSAREAADPGTFVGGFYQYGYDYFTGDYGPQYYVPGYYVANTDGSTSGPGSIVRVVALGAAVALGWAAGHRSRATRRAAQVAVGALIFGLLVALGQAMTSAALLLAVALALAWPVTRAGARSRGGAAPPPTPQPR